MASLAFLTLLPLGIMSKKHGWIGVDLDGTLARHDTTTQFPKIGEPIPKMLERVKQMLNEGYRVKIMTARVAYDHQGFQEQLIKEWCEHYIGVELEVTCQKDYQMIQLWDDRAIRIEKNTGEII